MLAMCANDFSPLVRAVSLGAQPFRLSVKDMADEVFLIVRAQIDELGGKREALSMVVRR
jgi:hypothetical protein